MGCLIALYGPVSMNMLPGFRSGITVSLLLLILITAQRPVIRPDVNRIIKSVPEYAGWPENTVIVIQANCRNTRIIDFRLFFKARVL